jgi:P4 family phage/plasmid primase-like protien
VDAVSGSSDDDFHDDGAPLDPDLDATDLDPHGIFADNYGPLRNLGWVGVLWLPEGKKAMPLGPKDKPLQRSLTGYAGDDADSSELHLIASSTIRRHLSGARGNIGVRAPRDVIVDGVAYDLVFVDVDDYVKGDKIKTGAKTVTEIEAKTGVPFPLTCKVTSRGDSVSGKYAYLIPAGEKLITALADVELVQWFHRYAVVPPSHNPDSGRSTFRAYTSAAPREGKCGGQPIDGMFRPSDAAIMPLELVAELRDATGFRNVAEVSDPEVRAFLDAMPRDPEDPKGMCKAVRNATDAGLLALEGAGNRYEATLRAVIRLLRIGHMGHRGIPAAFDELETAYVATQNAPGDTEKQARAEVKRMIENKRGISMILSDPTPEEDRGCRCGIVPTDDDIVALLEAGDEGVGVTLDEVRDMVGADRYDALAARIVPRTNGEAPSPVVTQTRTPAAVAVAPRTAHDPPAAQANGTPSEQQPARQSLRVETRRTEPVPPLHDFTDDDVGNGRRFIAVWGADVAWVPDAKLTYTWTGARWENDTGAQMRDLVERLTDFMLTEARLRLRPAQQRYDALAERPNDDPYKQRALNELKAAEAYLKWVAKSRMDPRLRACITSATSHREISVKSGQWDNDGWLLNLANGTIRLELDGSHAFYDHRRQDRLTQQSANTYDAEVTTPLFTSALERWLPNPAVRRVARALAGISLLGNNSRHKFPAFIGKERSGKTTLAEVVAGILDNPDEPGISYSGSFKLADLRPQSNGASPNASLFRIVRRRFVYCSESNDGGQPLSADLMKRFCGGDRQQARDTYGKAAGVDDRPPCFTPVLATNKTPEVEGADPALRERVIAIWFGNTIPASERDEDLPEKLKAEYPGILNWALEGYRDAVQNPSVLTDLPQECIEAAEQMYQAMNVYQRWKAEETVPSDNADEWITVDDSWQGFVGWCGDQHEKTGTKHKFGSSLKAEGHPSEVVWRSSDAGQEGPGRSARVRRGLAWNEQHHERIKEMIERYKAERDAAGGEFADHG